MTRYFVQFTRADAKEHHYYVEADDGDAALSACLLGLSYFECLAICDRDTVETIMPCG